MNGKKILYVTVAGLFALSAVGVIFGFYNLNKMDDLEKDNVSENNIERG